MGSKATKEQLREAQEFARSIVTSAEYKLDFHARAIIGDLPPQVETMLWAYAFGKPPNRLDIRQTVNDLRTKRLDELADEAESVARQLRAAKEAREQALELLRLAEEARANAPAPSVEQPTEPPSTPPNVHFGDFKSKVTH